MTDTALPTVIQQMLQPGFYPHPTQDPIQLIQTHISYVFLTGEYAYKVKKPMNFGFLDYSTLEKRQHFCQEELRLNHRGAPQIYLDVLPVTQQGDQIALGGEGSPVEYVLKMQQFGQTGLFSRLLAEGSLTEEIMVRLGQTVAAYHAKTESNDYIRSFGKVDQVRLAFDENYAQSEGYIGRAQTQVQFDETKAFTDKYFETHEDRFVARIRAFKIRECHGDLHLGNICLWHDQLLLFDCIEFNEPFRFVDVMYDIAYAVMDLDVKQRPDLANAYLNAYLEATGDWEGLKVLPIYLNRQSYVRAKVTSFLLDDPGASSQAKAEASQNAAAYYTLAHRYTQPRQGRITLMSGLSGSGKSTVARHWARLSNGIHIRSDAVRKHLAGIPLADRGDAAIYSSEMTAQTYERLSTLGLTLAQDGYGVILDAKYDQDALRRGVIEAAQAAGIPIQILHCIAPDQELRTRLEQRASAGQDIADATADLLEAQKQNWDPFGDLASVVIPIQTIGDWKAQLMDLL